jgi:hypothetical protein
MWVVPIKIFWYVFPFIFGLELAAILLFRFLNKRGLRRSRAQLDDTGIHQPDGNTLSWNDITGFMPLSSGVRLIDCRKKIYDFHIEGKSRKAVLAWLENKDNLKDKKKSHSFVFKVTAYLQFHKSTILILFIIPISLAPNGPRGEFLKIASAAGRNNVIELLLLLPTDINYEHGSDFPLLAATRFGETSTVKLLIERGADVNKLDPTGKSALSVARKNHLSEIEKILVGAGANR